MFKRLKRLFGGNSPKPFIAPPEGVPFEYAVVNASQVAEKMEMYRASSQKTPVFLGDRPALDQLLQQLTQPDDETFESIERASLEFDLSVWIADAVAADPTYFTARESTPGLKAKIPRFQAIQHARNKNELYIGLIPVAASWQVPAFLKPGGWNECPQPHVHVAFARHWHERYGAQIVTMTHDEIEFQVSRPPTTQSEALVLAREQRVYCSDLDAPLGSIAAMLLNSPNWYFWWD